MDFTSAIPDWKSDIGRLLDCLACAFGELPERTIVVFGSSPLQIFLDSTFLSQDCDIVGEGELEAICRTITLPTPLGDLAFQVCDALTFRTAQGWETRARREIRQGHTFVFPHPWDILASKVGRLEEKDLEAFRLVIRKTGGPTAEEFKQHLQLAVDLFRPNFDEERGADYTAQTRILWRTIYGGEIDVRAEIIRPALARRQAQYDADAGDSAWKEKLRNLERD